MNESQIAFCGLDCYACPARVATLRDDWFARRELAAQWTTPDYPVLAEDINCEGCKTGGERIFIFCRDCLIRRCGMQRGVNTCAECGDFPCAIIQRAPAEVRGRLSSMRSS